MVSEKMEPVASVVDMLKGFATATRDFTSATLHSFGFSSRRNPIEILKRLQRQAFSDIMKLRDRQDKVERLLTLKSSKVSLFHEASTRVRGEIQVSGLLLMIDRIHEENQDAIRRTGISTGINSWFTFETTIRERDTLTAELVSSNKGQLDALASPLSLAKVRYAANINDWFSLTAIPLGARCSDVGPSTSFSQEHGVTSRSFSGPPLLNQHIGSGIGLTVRKANVIASLAQCLSVLGSQLDSPGATHRLSTFAQVIYQLSTSTRFLLLGLHQVPKFSNQHVSLGPMAVPVGMFRHHKVPTEALDGSFGSTALALESELDACTRIGGWVEMNSSNARQLQWAVLISDLPEGDFGWGLTLGGSFEGSRNWDRYQAEAFSSIKLGERLSLQPTLVYAVDGANQFPGFMLKSSWSF